MAVAPKLHPSPHSPIARMRLIRCFAVQLLVVVLLHHSIAVRADTGNWEANCGVCNCKWISGKKTADCRNQSFSVVPSEFSSEMQVIDLSNNQIAELRRNEFENAGLENLHKIYLKNCTLMELNKDALRGLHVLIELDLSNNQIKQLHPGTFNGLIKLRTLLLNNNELERLDDFLFESLHNLSKLELRANRLHHVGLKVFVNTFSVTNIDLDHNQLTVLKEDTFNTFTNLKSLSLNGNPWNCTCNLQQFLKFVINKKLYTPPTSCVQPPSLRDKLWSDIPSEHFACKPRIVYPRTNKMVDAVNDNVTLTCRISGSPKPDIEWIFNKRTINFNDQRILIRNSQEVNRREAIDLYTSELTIIGVRSVDRGDYICGANNLGGKAEVLFHVELPPRAGNSMQPGVQQSSTYGLLLVVCLVVIVLLLILIVVGLVLCCYCRRIKKYSKNGSISENGLMVAGKMDKTHPANDSMLEGSVIMEMQKSLLTDVNPVEKPPRRAELDGGSAGDMTEEGLHELKKTLLDETMFGNQEDETQSVSLSDTTARSRTTYIDDGYGTNLPPDLLAFPSRFPQSPSLQSSISNMHDGHLYGSTKSPVASPIYQHHPVLYAGANSGYRTLQLPKQRNMTLSQHNGNGHQQRSQSPFTPAPILYPAVVMKQGYVTIPRKPRTPSWTPSLTASTMTADYPLTSPAMSPDLVEPVYDNLGLRTTASGNSVLNLNKIAAAAAAAAASASQHNGKFPMKDRPLPATPRANATAAPAASAAAAYEPIAESHSLPPHLLLHHLSANNHTADMSQSYGGYHDDSDMEALYVSRQPIATITNGVKVPPRPPPKPKKKTVGTVNGSTQLFEDECEDGTEV